MIDINLFAYYFPQYHSIPENDIVFGEGFSDWDLFKNADKPYLRYPIDPPNGLGYYDPRLMSVRKNQADLAKSYGINGFIYYHYWLENKPVMDSVLNNLIIDGEPNLPFCLCFANEPWKHCYGNPPFKKFYPDGSTFRQLYDEPEKHALYLEKIFAHKNYFKIDGLPVMFVYISEPKVYNYLNKISTILENRGGKKLYLIANISTHCLKNEFHRFKNVSAYSPFIAHTRETNEILPMLPNQLTNLNIVYGGLISWNNELRRPTAITYYTPNEISLNLYKDLFSIKNNSKALPLYALFAWNEWAEGAMIEPNTIDGDMIGKAILNTKTIFNIVNKCKELCEAIFEYGNQGCYSNVTYLVHLNCIKTEDNLIILSIPTGSKRNEIFNTSNNPTNHLKITIDNNIKEYDDDTEIYFQFKLNQLV